AVLTGRATDQDREVIKLLQEESDQAKKITEQQFQEQLAQLQSYDDRRAKMISDHQVLKEELLKRGYEREAEEAERQHQKTLDQMADQQADELKGFSKFFDNVEYMSRRAAKEGV